MTETCRCDSLEVELPLMQSVFVCCPGTKIVPSISKTVTAAHSYLHTRCYLATAITSVPMRCCSAPAIEPQALLALSLQSLERMKTGAGVIWNNWWNVSLCKLCSLRMSFLIWNSVILVTKNHVRWTWKCDPKSFYWFFGEFFFKIANSGRASQEKEIQ